MFAVSGFSRAFDIWLIQNNSAHHTPNIRSALLRAIDFKMPPPLQSSDRLRPAGSLLFMTQNIPKAVADNPATSGSFSVASPVFSFSASGASFHF